MLFLAAKQTAENTSTNVDWPAKRTLTGNLFLVPALGAAPGVKSQRRREYITHFRYPPFFVLAHIPTIGTNHAHNVMPRRRLRNLDCLSKT